MKAYAQDAEGLALKGGIVLDYREESLESIDFILHAIAGDNPRVPSTQQEENELWETSKTYGGYVGEVVIRNLGGAWELHDNPNGSGRVILTCQELQMFPAEKVYKRLTADQFSAVSGYCRAIRAIIARRPTK